MFLAVLGLDLRNPLEATSTSAVGLRESDELEDRHRTRTKRIADGAMPATQIFGDLLNYTRSRLGGGIPINRTQINLNELVHEVGEKISAAYP